MIRVVATPFGPRLYVLGLRVHHAHAGLLLIGAGVAAIARDWPDKPWPLRDPLTEPWR